MIGSILGLLALIAAVLPHWVVPILFPPEPIDQVIVETGHRVKERLIAHAKGVEYRAPRREKSGGDRFSEGFSTAAVSLGLLAIILAVLSQVFREEKLLAGISATLGVFAISVEISFIVIGALVLIAIVYAVMDHIDLF
jgi:hypothetical protein